jgi:hypothetical protein
MPQVPQYQSSLNTERLPDVNLAQKPLEAFGTGTARGLGDVGQVFNQIAQREIAEADDIAITQAETQLNSWTQDTLFHPKNGVLNRKGKNAFGLPDVVLPEFDKEGHRIAATLTTRRQQLAFWKLRGSQRVQLDLTLNRHESAQREAFSDQELISGLQDSISTATNLYNDPGAIRGQIQRQLRIVNTQAGREGWGAEQTDAAAKKTISLTHFNVVERMMSVEEKAMARGYYEAVKDQLSGEHATEIEKMFKIDDGVMKETLRIQQADMEAASRNGVVIESIPPEQVYVATYGSVVGGRMYQDAKGFQAVSRDVAALHEMTAGQLGTIGATYAPTQVEGAYSAAERQSIVETSAARIMVEREKDGAQYLISRNEPVTKAWNELMSDPNNAEAREEYIRLVDSESVRLGIFNSNIIPDSYANTLAAQVSNPKSNENLYYAVNREAQRWGTSWPRIMGQLASKLPDTVAVIASGIPPQAGIALAGMANLKTSELRGYIPNGSTWEELETAVKNKFETFLRSFPADTGGVRTSNAVYDSGLRLTLHHMRTGASMQASAQIAYEAMKNNDNLLDIHNVPFRYPSGLDQDTLEFASMDIIENLELPPDTLLGQFGFGQADEDRLEIYNDYVQDHGYWVTSPLGTGVQLYIDGAPVARGSVSRPIKIQYSWADLLRIGERRLQRAAEEDQKSKEAGLYKGR